MCDDVLLPRLQKSGIFFGVVVEKELFGKFAAKEREDQLAVKGHKDKLQRYFFEVVVVDFLLKKFAYVVQVLVVIQSTEGADEVVYIAIDFADNEFGQHGIGREDAEINIDNLFQLFFERLLLGKDGVDMG